MVRWGLIPVFAASLLLVGCGAPQETEAASTQSQTSAPATESTSPADDSVADTGRMIATYEDATTPEAINGRKIYQDSGMLEDMAAGATDLLKLPYDIPLVGQQCDQANAFWDPEDQQMIMCYEYVDFVEDMFAQTGDPDPLESAVNATYATFFHEMGHMVIGIYDLPATGREEDVADQLSAFMLLQTDDDGQLDPESVAVLRDAAREFAVWSELGELDESAFADEHSLDQTRMYNLLCWAYGADPDANSDLVDGDLLPEARAVRCEDEFDRMNYAWATLLVPYIKE
jgi:Putative metallopeptidase